MNYSELLQLAKGWGNFVSDRINIWRLHPENILQKMKKTEQKIYAMEQTKIHERIEEKKREATQQHSL